MEALEGVAKPRLQLQAGENLAGTRAWLRVRDNGPGMDAAQLARIWSPFVTSKQDGTGLGLAITRKLVEAHRGTVEAESEPGAGTTFVVTLPRDPDEAEESS
jgi:signal transduction histidine kinase